MKTLISKVVDGVRVETLIELTQDEEEELAGRPRHVPESITDRQFAAQLKVYGLISHQEAMDFVKTGAFPQTLAALVAAISDVGMREDMELSLAGAVEFHRHHPFTEMLRVSYGWSDDMLDDFWCAASQR